MPRYPDDEREKNEDPEDAEALGLDKGDEEESKAEQEEATNAAAGAKESENEKIRQKEQHARAQTSTNQLHQLRSLTAAQTSLQNANRTINPPSLEPNQAKPDQTTPERSSPDHSSLGGGAMTYLRDHEQHKQEQTQVIPAAGIEEAVRPEILGSELPIPKETFKKIANDIGAKMISENKAVTGPRGNITAENAPEGFKLTASLSKNTEEEDCKLFAKTYVESAKHLPNGGSCKLSGVTPSQAKIILSVLKEHKINVVLDTEPPRKNQFRK